MTAATSDLLGTDLSLRALRVVIDPRTGENSSIDRLYHSTLGWDRFEEAIYCPACHCNKSGDGEDPNGTTEACEGPCKCHAEDLCGDCEEAVDDPKARLHTGCCAHERVESDDIADGVVSGGRSHVYVTTCLDCLADLVPSEPDEDGDWGWDVV